MATTTTNFGWDIPQSTDLVKDGATAIAALGQDIDTALVDLKGGTTGQVLAKASGTDLDFSWVAVDPLTILDAKGDLISATAADTPARLAVGTNGQVLTADSTTSTGLAWATPSSSAGMTLLSTTSLSGTSTTISSISGSYNDLVIYVSDFYASSDFSILIEFNSDATGANYQQFVNRGTGSSNGAYVDNGSAGVDLTGYAIKGADNDNFAVIYIPNYASGTTKKVSNSIAGFIQTSGAKAVCNNNTYYAGATAALTSLKFKTTVGTFSGGTVAIYGVK